MPDGVRPGVAPPGVGVRPAVRVPPGRPGVPPGVPVGEVGRAVRSPAGEGETEARRVGVPLPGGGVRPNPGDAVWRTSRDGVCPARGEGEGEEVCPARGEGEGEGEVVVTACGVRPAIGERAGGSAGVRVGAGGEAPCPGRLQASWVKASRVEASRANIGEGVRVAPRARPAGGWQTGVALTTGHNVPLRRKGSRPRHHPRGETPRTHVHLTDCRIGARTEGGSGYPCRRCPGGTCVHYSRRRVVVEVTSQTGTAAQFAVGTGCVITHLSVHDAAGAIEFYKEAFGAVE